MAGSSGFEYYEENKNKTFKDYFFQRKTGVMISLTAVFLFAVYGVASYTRIIDRLSLEASRVIQFFVIFLFVFGVFVFISAYLEIFTTDEKIQKEILKYDINNIRLNLADNYSAIDGLRSEMESLALKLDASQANEIFKTKIDSRIEDVIGKNIDEFLDKKLIAHFDNIVNKYTDKQKREFNLKNIIEQKEIFINGMIQSVRKTSNSANVNLFSGLVLASVGILIMGYDLFVSSKSSLLNLSTERIVFEYASKFTFVVLVESIAFFLLRSYKEDKETIKYFRNEITNAESKYLASAMAIMAGSADDITNSIKNLSETERNFSIEKGKRTILESIWKENPILLEGMLPNLVEKATKIFEKPAPKS